MPLYTGKYSDDLLGIGQGDIIVLVGADTRHLQEVGKWITQQQMVLFEPDPDKRALAVNGNQSIALLVASDEAQLQDRLSRYLVYAPGRRVALMAPPEYRDRHPDVVEQAAKVVEQVVTWAELNHGTTRGRVSEWLDHLEANAPLMATLPDVSLLTGKLSRVPAIIVGAGPSIDDSIEDLAFAAERGIVMAAASALGPMAKAGLKPHIVLAMEARDESRQFIGDGLDKVFLAAASTSHPHHFKNWPGPQGLFHLYPWLSEISGGQSVPTGGHVTSAAFSMAAIWDCDPIILVGQDLAHTGGRAYGSGRIGAEEAQGRSEVQVEAIGGGKVGTTTVMHTYRLWYEEAARIFKSKWPDKRFINATKAGAHIQGFEYCLIEDALGEHPCFINGPDPILRALRDLPHPSKEELAEGLQRAAEHIDELVDTLRADGPEIARERAESATAAGFAMQNIAPPGADEAALDQALDQMRAHIDRMRASARCVPSGGFEE